MPDETPSPTPEQDPSVAASEAFPTEPAAEEIQATRSKRTFWQKLGGEGLTISLIIHLVLILIAAIWVISTVTDSVIKDPDSFSTGQGGGAAGDKAKQFKTRAQPKNPKSMAKNAARITSKSSTATISLPDLPTSSVASLNTGMMGGGSSKGFGGGSGGGIGSGMGVGRGNGRNFVSLFGAKVGTNGLVGTFYDLKQTPSRRETECAPQSGIGAYREAVRDFFESGWSPTKFSKYYKAPEPLIAGQLFIPSRSANAAPEAYGVEKEVKPSRWVVHYKGTVEVPQSLPFRFVGTGDDWLLVRWDKKIALDDGYEHFIVGRDGNYKDFKQVVTKEFVLDRSPGGLHRMKAGPWINETKGKKVPIEIAIGETPGGVFDVYLAIEVATSGQRVKGEFVGEGTLKLFRVNSDPLPKEIENPGRKLTIDMQAEGWIFKTVAGPGVSR
ncbi:hypothetical protein EMGBS10_11440 [Opitutia bacterium]|nr:hypothetical protein EMGBS10_11440 [Opitutae bacterium]